MTTKEIGDRVKSTTHDPQDGHKVQSVLEGTILKIEHDVFGVPVFAVVQQDDGITARWSL